VQAPTELTISKQLLPRWRKWKPYGSCTLLLL